MSQNKHMKSYQMWSPVSYFKIQLGKYRTKQSQFENKTCSPIGGDLTSLRLHEKAV